MVTETRPEIYVPELVEDDRIIVPAVALGREIEYRTTGEDALTIAEYQAFNPPTLAELRHAYLDKDDTGNWVAPEYRESALSNRNRCECTSTFLADGTRIVERPERLFYDDTCGLWIAEADPKNVHNVELPPTGWITGFDLRTGFPCRTGSREDAIREFGNDASIFYAVRTGFRAVFPIYRSDGYGRFHITTALGPDGRSLNMYARSSRVLEQDDPHFTAAEL